MTKRRRVRQRSVPLSEERLTELASAFALGHGDWIALGCRLTGTRRLWRAADGTWTGRFVYRRDDAFSLVQTVSGIAL